MREKSLFFYQTTKKADNKWYMQCRNRYRGVTTGAKCLSNAHYNPTTHELLIRSPHNDNCGSSTKITVRNDYQLQREELKRELQNDSYLTPSKAILLLRNTNNQRDEEEKLMPLSYAQTKKAIETFRLENHIPSSSSIDDPWSIHTKDGALFRRAHIKESGTIKGKISD